MLFNLALEFDVAVLSSVKLFFGVTREIRGSYSEGATGREMAAPLWSLSVRWEEDFHWNHSVSQFVVRLSLRTEVWLIFSEERISSFWTDPEAAQKNGNVLRWVFVCLISSWLWICCGSLGGAAARCRQVMDVSGVQGEELRRNYF